MLLPSMLPRMAKEKGQLTLNGSFNGVRLRRMSAIAEQVQDDGSVLDTMRVLEPLPEVLQPFLKSGSRVLLILSDREIKGTVDGHSTDDDGFRVTIRAKA